MAEETNANASTTAIANATPAAMAVQPAPQAPKKARKQTKKASQKKVPETQKSKRKEAVARASLRPGNGTIRVNGANIETIESQVVRETMLEVLALSQTAKDMVKNLNITVNVRGGGRSSQMQAVRNAIAKALSDYDETGILRKEIMNYDRALLVDDPRRVEPKKFEGPKARSRFQTSYR
jgi:small subunit ribosomal protein S9